MSDNSPRIYIGAGLYAPSGRGGGRNRANRITDGLSESQVAGLIEATHFAVAVGMPFNRFTTIHWGAAGVSEPMVATSLLLKGMGEAVRRSGSEFACIWARENGDGKGEHLHILWHGPADFPALRSEFSRTLKACGAARLKGVRETLSIARHLLAASNGSAVYQINLDGVLDYVLKGADKIARATHGVKREEFGGRVVGKRCGTTNNIGREARRRYGLSGGQGADKAG
ncbi:hypothetical protein [Brevundimonas sp.]|uniref:hypothetical protein n=1 Tax=Brevundimonas sp. TaxID=1871086 RepID=UPI002FC6F1D5